MYHTRSGTKMWRHNIYSLVGGGGIYLVHRARRRPESPHELWEQRKEASSEIRRPPRPSLTWRRPRLIMEETAFDHGRPRLIMEETAFAFRNTTDGGKTGQTKHEGNVERWDLNQGNIDIRTPFVTASTLVATLEGIPIQTPSQSRTRGRCNCFCCYPAPVQKTRDWREIIVTTTQQVIYQVYRYITLLRGEIHGTSRGFGGDGCRSRGL